MQKTIPDPNMGVVYPYPRSNHTAVRVGVHVWLFGGKEQMEPYQSTVSFPASLTAPFIYF